MSLSDVTNRMRNIEARITEIGRRADAFEPGAAKGDDVTPNVTEFRKVLDARKAAIDKVEAKAAPPAEPAGPLVVPAKTEGTTSPRPAPAPAVGVPVARRPQDLRDAVTVDADGFIRPRLVSESRTPRPAEVLPDKPEARAVTPTPKDLMPTILEAAKRYRLDPALVESIIGAESDFNGKTVSNKGALGLMQLMPGTADDMGVEDPFDPEENIYGGTRYLRKMLDRFGDLEKAVAAYNAGPEKVERHGGVPPIDETQQYVKRVMSEYAQRRNGDLFEE